MMNDLRSQVEDKNIQLEYTENSTKYSEDEISKMKKIDRTENFFNNLKNKDD